MPRQSEPVSRTAPIAIAPKPSQADAARYDHYHRSNRSSVDAGLGSMHSYDSPGESDSSLSGSSTFCAACLSRRINCVVNDDEEGCVSCQVLAVECSLISQSPQTRKRKLAQDLLNERSGKRG